VWYYLRDPTFSRFDTILECGRHTQTDRHTTMAHTALNIASRSKNEVKCQRSRSHSCSFTDL